VRKFDQSLPMALLRARETAMSFFRPMLHGHGLTEQQWRVIRVLQEYGNLEFHELSRIACIQPPSLTGILTRLERSSLVRRSRSAVDQRRLHVVLTPAGKRRFALVSRDAEQQYGLIERQLGRARLRALMTGLYDLAELPLPADARTTGNATKARVSRPRPRARSRR
jgi:homoprotocatechuate degradation regulator HpaR